MSQFHYRTVGRDFLDTAPIRVTVSQEIPCTPNQLLEVFADGDAWTDWMGLDSVEWTSPRPFTKGTTRTITSGPFTFSETFTHWDVESGIGFYFDGGSTSLVDAFLEDYRVKETADGCEVTWHVGIALAGIGKIAQPLVGPYMRRFGARGFKNLAKFVTTYRFVDNG